MSSIFPDSPDTLDSGISLGIAPGGLSWIEMSRLSYGRVWCVHGKSPPTNLLQIFSIHSTTLGAPGHTLLWTLSPVVPHRLGTPCSPWLFFQGCPLCSSPETPFCSKDWRPPCQAKWANQSLENALGGVCLQLTVLF